MKYMIYAFLFLPLYVSAHALPDYEIRPYNREARSGNIGLVFNAYKVDRIKNRIYVCEVSGKRREDLKGYCSPHKISSKLNIKESHLGEILYIIYDRLKGGAEIWAIDSKNGNVTFCRVGINCIDVPTRE